MTDELRTRYRKKLNSMKENVLEFNNVTLLTDNEVKTMIGAILALMEENAELKSQVTRLENIVDQFDPAPKYKKEQPTFKTTKEELDSDGDTKDTKKFKFWI